MTTAAAVRLAFSGLHPGRQARLTRELGGADAVVAAIEAGRVECTPSVRRAVGVDPDDRRASLSAAGVSLVFRQEDGYPSSLNDLLDAPDHLFVRGEMPSARKAVAVVGSRRATAYGTRVARLIGRTLGGADVAVVSGLARGIDASAHWGTIDSSGPAWAVLGCGIDRWYPRGNAALGREILERGGTIISEYPPGTDPLGWRFPLRNRIISGLSCAVVVVEAAVTGGALITARLALDQGRDVFAVPGDIDRTVSEGCNRLIADGAVPVTSIDDLMCGLGFLHAMDPTQPSVPGLEAIGPLGATPEEIGACLGLDPTETRVRLGRWEALGLVRRRGELIERI